MHDTCSEEVFEVIYLTLKKSLSEKLWTVAGQPLTPDCICCLSEDGIRDFMSVLTCL